MTDTPALTAEERAKKLWDHLLGSYESFSSSWEKAIASAIRDAECATEERCYLASEELCAKIAEMHDELEHLRSLKSQKETP